MSAANTKASGDFSDLAILRASAVAMVTLHLLVALLIGIVTVWSSPISFDADDILQLVGGAGMIVVHPEALIFTLCALSVAVVIGLMFLAAGKDDPTTYRAAIKAGLKTAAVALILPLFILMATSVGNGSRALEGLISLGVGVSLALGVGALTGIVARFAAGSPLPSSENPPAVS